MSQSFDLSYLLDLHEYVNNVLPWYVNGTLTQEERNLVVSHLNLCLGCRIELRKLERLGAAVASETRAGTCSLGPLFQRLMVRIRAEESWRAAR